MESGGLVLRPLERGDLPACGELLSACLARFKLAPILTEQELVFKLRPRPPFVYSWVIEDAAIRKPVAFFSFYCLRSPCYLNRVKTEMRAACMSYCAPGSSLTLRDMVVEALHQAAAIGCALMLCVDNYGHGSHLSSLAFKPVPHSDVLYQIYNWRAASMAPGDVGLVFW